MKKILLLLILTLAACQPAPATAPTPAPATASPTAAATPTLPPPTLTPLPTPTVILPLHSPNGAPLLRLRMFGSLKGWGVLENQLLLTEDGGRTWQGVPVPGEFRGAAGTAFFQSAEMAMVLTSAPEGAGGLLHITRDRGQTWESVPVPAARGQIQFMPNTDRESFLFTDMGEADGAMAVALYQSLDHLVWDRTFAHTSPETINGLPFEGIKHGVYFVNPSAGWMYGKGVEPEEIYLFATTDAGRNWQSPRLKLPPNLPAFTTQSLPPLFVDGQKGFLFLNFISVEGQGVTTGVYSSTDEGKTWQLVSTLPGVSAFHFVNAEKGWAWAGRQLYLTQDAAQTWQPVPVAFSSREVAAQIEFTDERYGWLLTVDDRSQVRLHQSTDGGYTWLVVIP
jgi:photosystem II stability/assembly factor-like uncharacterized protein